MIPSAPTAHRTTTSGSSPSAAPGLSNEVILDAGEAVLRRFGPAKASVVDIARALGVSHAAVYRYYPSKAALRDAIAERWLRRISTPLEAVAGSGSPADERLHEWLAVLTSTKQQMAREDPELFATFHELTVAARDVATAHVAHLCAQVSRIVADGIAAGHFAAQDPDASGRAVVHGTARFHHPALSREWGDPATLERELEAVLTLLLRGLRQPG